MNSKDRNIGASVVVGLGIINISLVNNLKRSAAICQAPLRPIRVGPIRRWAKDRTLRSDKTQNRVKRTTNKELSSIASDIFYIYNMKLSTLPTIR